MVIPKVVAQRHDMIFTDGYHAHAMLCTLSGTLLGRSEWSGSNLALNGLFLKVQKWVSKRISSTRWFNLSKLFQSYHRRPSLWGCSHPFGSNRQIQAVRFHVGSVYVSVGEPWWISWLIHIEYVSIGHVLKFRLGFKMIQTPHESHSTLGGPSCRSRCFFESKVLLHLGKDCRWVGGAALNR